ncbi:hypothetical protein SBRCBS47491_004292 [Sporothrix bragantina]|uniref:Uncharacterized protein n=1 Tax=Sporothrix bragantina TaxID=671064 RepID=A0ABP0BMA6_9PEZI
MLPTASAPRYNGSGSASSVQTTATKSSGVRSRNNSAGTSSSSSGPRSQTPLELDRGLTESPADFRVARKAEVTSAHTITIYPELDRYRDIDIMPSTSDGYGQTHPDILFRLATEGLPAPPTPYYSGTNSLTSGMSGSPSTRWSESPGPGPYSRDTTPTSMSSHSPGLMASVRMPSAPRMRQPVRVRTGSFGKDSMSGSGAAPSVGPTQTLAAIRESLNSSSSSSNGTGPAAGTGHEGYGKLGSGRRRSSSVSTFLRGTGSSQESLSSPQFQDPFLRDRLSPVVIAGGEVIENQNNGYDLSQTTSNTSTSTSANANASVSANLGAHLFNVSDRLIEPKFVFHGQLLYVRRIKVTLCRRL